MFLISFFNFDALCIIIILKTRGSWATSLCAKFGWNLPSGFLKFRQRIFTISLLSFFKNGRGSSFEQTYWIPFTQECFVPSFVEIGQLVLEKAFKILLIYVCYFVIISPWKTVWSGSLIWTDLNPLYPKMILVQNWVEIGWVDTLTIRMYTCICALTSLTGRKVKFIILLLFY